MQSECGKGISVGVHIICIYVCGPNFFFESYLSNRLTFSNIRGRTSRQINRLALPLLLQKRFPRRVNN